MTICQQLQPGLSPFFAYDFECSINLVKRYRQVAEWYYLCVYFS